MDVRAALSRLPLLFVLLPLLASAQGPGAFVVDLRRIAFALGWIMMVFMGVKWIVSDSANDRSDAKKGMIYIVIGLLIVASACQLIQLYCNTAQQSVPAMVCNIPAGLCT